jgi:hypothetical protein
MAKKAKRKDKKQEPKRIVPGIKMTAPLQEMTIGIELCQTIRSTNRRAD